LSLGFYNHSPPCLRGGLRRHYAPGSLAPAPPGGPPSTFLSINGGHSRTPRGPAIDIFNFGDGRYRTCHQHPQGACHRCLQLRWWSLLDLPLAPPRGPAIDVFNFSGGRCQKYRQHPQWARHRGLQLRWWPLPDLPPTPHSRCLQLRWWPLPEIPTAPPGVPPSTFLSVDGGRSRTFSSGTSRGPRVLAPPAGS
jgi:hypothetical protein